VESLGRSCKLRHGQPCDQAGQCDSLVNLICKDGTCSCNDFEVYDEDRKKCRGLIGGQCHTTEEDNDRTLWGYCVDGALCENYRDPGIGKGTCRCLAGFQPNSERKCERVMVLELKAGNESNDTVELLPINLNGPSSTTVAVPDASSFEEVSS
jgi:hypothetical protein